MTFFGLTLNNVDERRKSLFTQIHEIVFYGNGGYTWPDVYNMPIWLRKFTFHLLKEHYEEKSKSQDSNLAIDESGNVKNKQAFNNQQQTTTKITPGPQLNRPPVKYK